MNEIHVLCVDIWDGRKYYRELIEAYPDKAKAEAELNAIQGNRPNADTRYFVETVEVVE